MTTPASGPGSTSIDTVVIGAGQAGLCMSQQLSERGVEHVVLERARVGERWRTERWDSLRFQFPNRYVRLPGFEYDGDDPDGFMPFHGVVEVLDRYANHIAAPVRCGVNVRSVDRIDSDRFAVVCDDFELRARNVVVATGPYQRPIVPEAGLRFPPETAQLTASSFTNAGALPTGAVLVVGSGGSGVQIAEDLVDAGRHVYLSVGSHRRMPRRYRDRDITDWFEDLGFLSAPIVKAPEIDHSPLLTGVDGGHDVDLRDLVERGAQLLGRLEDVIDGRLVLGDNLHHDIAKGDESFGQMTALIDSQIAARGMDAPPPTEQVQLPLPPESPSSLDIAAADISSIIWATGYRVDFSWVQCGEFADDGTPVQSRGVSDEPGLYFLGLAGMHSAGSSIFWSVGEDAEHLAEHLVARS